LPKTKRGKALWGMDSRGRGTCPVCLSTRIKLLYTVTHFEGKQLQVCKRCKSAPKTRMDRAIPAESIAFRRRHRKWLNKWKAVQIELSPREH